MTFIKILNVSHNALNSVPRNTFPKLYELHTIDLSYNNISEIHNSIFQTLFSLRSLNLAHNSLEKIHPSTFGSLTTLLELDMSYNKLREISRGSLTRLGSCRWDSLLFLLNLLSSSASQSSTVSYFQNADSKTQQFDKNFPITDFSWSSWFFRKFIRGNSIFRHLALNECSPLTWSVEKSISW